MKTDIKKISVLLCLLQHYFNYINQISPPPPTKDKNKRNKKKRDIRALVFFILHPESYQMFSKR